MNEIKEIKIDLKDKSYKIFINDDIEKILVNSIEKILARPKSPDQLFVNHDHLPKNKNNLQIKL